MLCSHGRRTSPVPFATSNIKILAIIMLFIFLLAKYHEKYKKISRIGKLM
jgi:hypothetical protein